MTRYALDMHKFYTKRLNISTRQLQTMPWNDVVERIIALHRRERIQKNKEELTAHDIASRIMRKDNYLIAMYVLKQTSSCLGVGVVSTVYLMLCFPLVGIIRKYLT